MLQTLGKVATLEKIASTAGTLVQSLDNYLLINFHKLSALTGSCFFSILY